MERIEKLKKEITALEEQENEIRKEPDKYKIESKTPVLEDDELEEYKTLSDDQKREKYTQEQCETADEYLKIVEETEAKREKLEKQINDKVVELYEEVDKEIKESETIIAENEKQIEALKGEIESIKSQIQSKEQELQELASKEDYNKDEYANIEQEIEELNMTLRLKNGVLQTKIDANNKEKEKLGKLKQEKQTLIEEHGDIITSSLEAKLSKIRQQWQVKKDEVQEKMKKSYALKQTKKYKAGDEKTVQEVKALESEILFGVLAREELASQMAELGKAINEVSGREVATVEHDGLSKRVKAAQEARKEADSKEPKNSEKQPEKSVEEDVGSGQSEEKPTSTKKEEKQEKPTIRRAPVYNGAPGAVVPNGVTEPDKEEKPKESEKPEVEQPKEPKEKFNELYAQVKKGTLDDKGFEELAEIMSDPENYDKYGITTGILSNKSKTILRAMGKRVGNADGLSKKIKEIFGTEFAAEKVSKENGLIHSADLTVWSVLRQIINNPNSRVSAEEQFKKIVGMDRTTLTEEQQELWDKAQAQLSKYSSLRGALTAYGEVTKQRTQKRTSWLSGFNKKKTPELPPETPAAAPTPISEIDEYVNTGDLNSIPPKAPTIDDPNKGER